MLTVDAHSGDKKSQQTTIMVRLYGKVVVNKWEGAAPIGTTLHDVYFMNMCVYSCVSSVL